MSTNGSLVKFDPRSKKFFIKKVENSDQTKKERIVQAFYDSAAHVCVSMPSIFIGRTAFNQGWETSSVRRLVRQVAYRHRDMLVGVGDDELDGIVRSFISELKCVLVDTFKSNNEFIPAVSWTVSEMVKIPLEEGQQITA